MRSTWAPPGSALNQSAAEFRKDGREEMVLEKAFRQPTCTPVMFTVEQKALKQWLSTGGVMPPRGHLGTSGDTRLSHVGRVSCVWWVEARGVAKHPVMRRTSFHNKD